MNNTFKKHLESKDLSKATIAHYHYCLIDFLAWLDRDNTEAENATVQEITAYLNYLKNKGQGNLTRSIRLNALKHFFDYQIQQEQRENNPAHQIKIRGIKRKTLYPLLSIQELESLYYNYEVPKEDDPRNLCNWFGHYRLARQRNKVMLGLMIWQGLVTTEVTDLKLTDLKLKEGKIYIAGNRKSNEKLLELKPQQIIELIEYLQTTRKELLQYCTESNDYLFISAPAASKSKSTGKGAENVWKRLTQDVKKQSPRFINFLQIRSSVITHWTQQYNLREAQYMAGHKYVSTTETYKLNNLSDLQDEIGKFHPIN